MAYPQFQPTPGFYFQRVGELLDYSIDYSDSLSAGDVITASSWTSDQGLTLSDETFTGTTTTVWVSGGVAQFLYKVWNTVTTAGGRILIRKLRFLIRDDGLVSSS
ncbi:hypothetical protein AWB91_08910 [Mycobacterium paraense]|uniref:Uncharacterized protein n=1 Tax=Mycobacterium paraense TaxID=767916 RepID=A0ABX3VT25_9MYCO|nr:hypothetical protein AWB91_08910 [Mycobacterium paraense]ORW38939.1 hypothetical protein AWB88_17805 [Mycobacterium paraense]